jgi:hypothetical protein
LTYGAASEARNKAICAILPGALERIAVRFAGVSYLLCEYTSRMASTTKLGWSNGMYSELLSVNNCLAF